MSKTLNTRIQHKTDTTANWNLATTFKPLKGELIIYDDGNGQPPKFKIGNGSSTVTALPFATAEQVAKATSDASGNVITSTYATKAELTTGLNGKANSSHKHTKSEITDLPTFSDTNTTYDLGASGTTNGAVKINLTAGGSGSGTDSISINGTGGTTVTASGNTITINSATTSGGPSLSSSTPKVASGSGAAGSSSEASRADHVHPVQTTVDTATKLSTATAGSTKQPVYFTDGKPAAISYTIEKSVPSNAVFTDTNTAHAHSAGTGITLTGSGGTSGTTTISLATSGVTANSYGPPSGGTLSHSGTFRVPYITVDETGRITSATDRTFTLPASSGGGGGGTTPTIYPPTLSAGAEDHMLRITPSSNGATPDRYIVYVNGVIDTEETADGTNYVEVDLWDLTGSANNGPNTFNITVKAASDPYGDSSLSNPYTYTNYIEASSNHSFDPNEALPIVCSPRYTVKSKLGIIDTTEMNWDTEGYTVTVNDTNKTIEISNSDPYVTTLGYSSGSIKIRYIRADNSVADKRDWWIVETLDIIAEECLVAGTQILMADGSTKNIEDVRRGDMLRSWDIITKTPIDVVCTASMYTGRDVSVDTMKFKDGKYLQICRAHAIYNSRVHANFTNKKWQIGDAGKGIDGEELILENQSTAIHDTPVKHYTLHTENGLYYANGILCGHFIERSAIDIRKQMNKLGYTEEEVQAIEAEALINYKERMWSTDEAYIAMMATKPNTNDLRKQIQQAKDSLTARDYKTIKRLQGFIDDAEWAENISICQGLRDVVNNVTKELEDTIAFSRQARVSLGYPEKIRSRGEQFRASQKLLNEIIRSHRENK